MAGWALYVRKPHVGAAVDAAADLVRDHWGAVKRVAEVIGKLDEPESIDGAALAGVTLLRAVPRAAFAARAGRGIGIGRRVRGSGSGSTEPFATPDRDGAVFDPGNAPLALTVLQPSKFREVDEGADATIMRGKKRDRGRPENRERGDDRGNQSPAARMPGFLPRSRRLRSPYAKGMARIVAPNRAFVEEKPALAALHWPAPQDTARERVAARAVRPQHLRRRVHRILHIDREGLGACGAASASPQRPAGRTGWVHRFLQSAMGVCPTARNRARRVRSRA